MMEMDAKTTVAVIDNLLKHGRNNIVTRNALENAKRLLEEQEDRKNGILMRIADYQLAVSPTGYEDDREVYEYRRGQWQGLQDAFEMLTEGDEK